MPVMRTVKTNFTAGEVTPRLIGRGDLRAYENGARALHNLFVYATGGVTRRAGLEYIDTAAGDGRLASFEFNTEQNYLFVFTHLQLAIYLDGALATTLVTPWTLAQLSQLNWAQSADTFLVCHPDVAPVTITRSASGWQLANWQFASDPNGVTYQPYYKFADSAVTLTPSATTGAITIVASADFFVTGHANTIFRINGKQIMVTAILSPTVASATVLETLTALTATTSWQEQSFSAVRGWPISVVFHQDRLVIGGARDLPNRLWLSQSGRLWNFNLATGLDDEAIEFGILSDQVNAIRAVFSGRHLQVFTSGAEWMVTGTPLTPASIQLNRQTRVGSIATRTVAPVDVDGATLFAARSGHELREFLFNDGEQAYDANDLSLIASHIVVDPVSIAYDKLRRLLFMVRADGSFATLTLYRAETVTAWTQHSTDGFVKAVTVVGDNVYALTNRNGAYFIEQFADGVPLDAALSGTALMPTTVWGGLAHLNGRTVDIIADGVVQPAQTVVAGHVTLSEAAMTVAAGLPFTHRIEPMPPNSSGTDGAGRTVRLVEIILRVANTAALRLDTGAGLRDVALRPAINAEFVDAPPPAIDGDIAVRGRGWRRDLSKPLWVIEQDTPLPFTLLSVVTAVHVNL